MKRIELAMNTLFRYSNAVSMIILFSVMLVAVANVVLRAVINFPILGTLDYVRLMTLCAVSFALAYNESLDGNVAVTLVVDMLKPKAANIINCFTNIFSLAFTAFAVKLLFDAFLGTVNKGDLSETLKWPLYIFYFIMMLGFIMLTIALILKLINRIATHKDLPNKRATLEEIAKESADSLL